MVEHAPYPKVVTSVKQLLGWLFILLQHSTSTTFLIPPSIRRRSKHSSTTLRSTTTRQTSLRDAHRQTQWSECILPRCTTIGLWTSSPPLTSITRWIGLGCNGRRRSTLHQYNITIPLLPPITSFVIAPDTKSTLCQCVPRILIGGEGCEVSVMWFVSGDEGTYGGYICVREDGPQDFLWEDVEAVATTATMHGSLRVLG